MCYLLNIEGGIFNHEYYVSDHLRGAHELRILPDRDLEKMRGRFISRRV